MGLYSRVVFPRLCDWVMSDPRMAGLRSELLADVGGEVLEIGFGTGLNLPHYPEHVRRITTVDPNPGMNRLARRRIAEGGIDVDQRVLSGEALPFEDGTFDCVVSTWTLCSIPDAGRALGEVYRVLRPGGRFVFLEHGLSERSQGPAVAAAAQPDPAGAGRRLPSRPGRAGARRQPALRRPPRRAVRDGAGAPDARDDVSWGGDQVTGRSPWWRPTT